MSLLAGRPAPLTKRVRLRLRRPVVLAFLFAAFVLTFFLSRPGFDLFHVRGSPGGEPVANVVPNAVKGKPRYDFALQPQLHALREPQTQHQHWRVTTDYRRPDGVLKSVYLINDEFPGPTLETRPGDRLIIEVENALNAGEGIALHWHGLSEQINNDTGGAQKAIMPGESFIYNFTHDASQHGTFWYSAMEPKQRMNGLYGGLIIHAPATMQDARHLDKENLLMIDDWYHSPSDSVVPAQSSPGAPDAVQAVPDSIMVNGAGKFQCADTQASSNIDCVEEHASQLAAIEFRTGVRNILRVVNIGARPGIVLSVHGSELTVTSINGNTPTASNASESTSAIKPGERVDILVQLNPVIAHYRSQLEVRLQESDMNHGSTPRVRSQTCTVRWLGI